LFEDAEMRRILVHPFRYFAVAALAGVACFSSTGPDDFYGTWVADGVALTLHETIARFEITCWTGDLSIPIIVDDESFTAPGTLTSRGGAGATETRLVQFTGRLDGDRLGLTITPEALGLGPYELRMGNPPEFPGCPAPAF
jgi:hypothetical protein